MGNANEYAFLNPNRITYPLSPLDWAKPLTVVYPDRLRQVIRVIPMKEGGYHIFDTAPGEHEHGWWCSADGKISPTGYYVVNTETLTKPPGPFVSMYEAAGGKIARHPTAGNLARELLNAIRLLEKTYPPVAPVYAYHGEISTCERGHPLATIMRDVRVGEHPTAVDFKLFPKVKIGMKQCPHCGGKVHGDNVGELFFDGALRSMAVMVKPAPEVRLHEADETREGHAPMTPRAIKRPVHPVGHRWK